MKNMVKYSCGKTKGFIPVGRKMQTVSGRPAKIAFN
jgi:hypothetical protein